MKRFTTRLLAIGAFSAAAAFAQTAGILNVTGVIPEGISMTDTTGVALSTTQSLGTLTAANSSTLAAITPVAVRIRSNKAYKLSAAMTLTNAATGALDGGDSIAASDIGFGITASDALGANVATPRTDAIAPIFNYVTTAMSALPVTNGMTPFVTGINGTLADIASITQVVQGNRASKKGNMQTTNNFVQLSFGVATLPQYFTPTTGFTAVITLTAATM